MARRRLQQKGDLYQQGGWWKLRWREDRAGGGRGWSRPVYIGPAQGAGHLTEKQAQRLAWENFLSRMDQNNVTPQCVMTVEEFVARKFTPEHVAMLKPAGRNHYAAMLKRILPAIGKTRLRDVRRDDVQVLVSSVIAEGKSPQTVKHVRNAASAIFTFAEEIGYFTGTNPAKHVKIPEVVLVRQRHSLTWEQAGSVLARLKSPATEMALSCMVMSCNIAELLGLLWRHLNLSADWATIDGQAVPPWHAAIRQQWYRGAYGSLKEKSRERNIPIPPILRDAFLEMKTRARFTGDEDPIFAGRSGKPLDEHNYAKRHLKPIGQALSMPWLSWHVFRRSHATFTKAIGMSDLDRQRLMGHASISMTDRYTDSDTERRAEALDVLARKLVEAKNSVLLNSTKVSQLADFKGATIQ